MVAEERLVPVPLALLPVERLTLPPEEEEERVACCWLLPEERLAEVVERRSCWADVRTGVPVVWVTVVVVEERVMVPEERVVEPEERVVEPEDWLTLPEERVVEPELDRVVEPLPVERDWASISGAVSRAKASVREVAMVVKRLIVSSFLGLTV